MIEKLIQEMIAYDKGDPKRVGHFLKVYGYAKTIGRLEEIPAPTQEILEAAAVTHDVGIRASIRKYGSDAGSYQQIEGPPIAKTMLQKLQFPQGMTERVCYLISRHHTYEKIDGLDYQILVEADFLVNIHENQMKKTEIETIRSKIFRTEAGIRFLELLYA